MQTQTKSLEERKIILLNTKDNKYMDKGVDVVHTTTTRQQRQYPPLIKILKEFENDFAYTIASAGRNKTFYSYIREIKKLFTLQYQENLGIIKSELDNRDKEWIEAVGEMEEADTLMSMKETQTEEIKRYGWSEESKKFGRNQLRLEIKNKVGIK